MNETLVNNWNSIVEPDADVLFLGDLTMEADFGTFQHWIDRLNGHVHFVIGDHDVSVMALPEVDLYEHFQFKHRGIPFFAIHDPDAAPRNWNGWVLHGHHHNNWPDQYPFINTDRRFVNLSVECIDYTPLAIERLVELLLEFRSLQTIADAKRSSSGE